MVAERVIWVFLDGVGLGAAAPEMNPFASNLLSSFRRLGGDQRWTAEASPVRANHHLFVPIDALLGVPGLPQSGTGQATMFTGVNCAALAGRHWGPFPHSSSKPVIAEKNVFSRLHRAGRTGQFLNAFPDRFFRAVEPRDRWSVTTRCCVEAGIPLKKEADLRAGHALAADLTGLGWHDRLGLDVPVISPYEAGARLLELASDADLTLFEYYLTDKAGHSRSMDRARQVLADVDAFFGAVLDRLDEGRHLLLVTSDHGNLEDLSRRVHTMNPVPLVALGAGAASFHEASDLTSIVPALLELLGHAHGDRQ